MTPEDSNHPPAVNVGRRLIENTDRLVACQALISRLQLAGGDAAGAAAILAAARQGARQHNFAHLLPEVAAAQVLTLLRQGNLGAAGRIALAGELPICQARVHLARGETSKALAMLEPARRLAAAKSWEDELLKVMVLNAVAHHAHGERDKAVQLLSDALALAEPGGFIRLFVDEGVPMARLLAEASARGIMPDYVGKLLAVLAAEAQKGKDESRPAAAEPLIEPLSKRELEVLRLIAQGLSNQEISERLFLALSSVKGHNFRIFGKLQVQRRTEAVARAREMGLL